MNAELKLAYDISEITQVEKIKKDPTEVHVTLDNGTSMRGFFYVTDGQRVAEVMNDDRRFIPFLDAGDSVRLLNKRNVVEVKPA